MNAPKVGLLLFVAAFALLSAPAALAQGTYTQIDVPGAYSTSCSGINTAGDVIGNYVDTSGDYHGFLLSGGAYTTIDYPSAQDTYLYGFNDAGQFVGWSNGDGGYLYDSAIKTFSSVKYPHAAETFPVGINNAGTIAGWADVSHAQGVETGFALVGSTYSRVAPPNASDVFVTGISASGRIVGAAGNEGNFLFNQGMYRRLTITGATNATVNGINPAGTSYVGGYELSSEIEAGYLYKNGALQTLQFPGSYLTIAYGVNAAGKVAGTFNDINNNTHCFAWTPPAAGAVKK